MFGRSRPSPSSEPASVVVSAAEMGLDTVGAILRILGEYALDQEKTPAAVFTALSERWAQHVLIGAPPPNAPPGADGTGERRDWSAVREFVREYCRGASSHASSVMGDLRQVVWVFIQNLSHAVAEDAEADAR